MQRLSADTVETVEVAQRYGGLCHAVLMRLRVTVITAGCVLGWRCSCSGEDDEQIQYQRQQAGLGDEVAMIAMGSLLYYGARGLARNQQEAYRW